MASRKKATKKGKASKFTDYFDDWHKGDDLDSPFTSDVLTIEVGAGLNCTSQRFNIHASIFRRYFTSDWLIADQYGVIGMAEVTPATFALVASFLYTGSYDLNASTGWEEPEPETRIIRQYEAHIHVYCCALRYGAPELRDVAIANIETLDFPSYDCILKTAKTVYSGFVPWIDNEWYSKRFNSDDWYRRHFKDETQKAIRTCPDIMKESYIVDVFEATHGPLSLDLFTAFREEASRAMNFYASAQAYAEEKSVQGTEESSRSKFHGDSNAVEFCHSRNVTNIISERCENISFEAIMTPEEGSSMTSEPYDCAAATETDITKPLNNDEDDNYSDGQEFSLVDSKDSAVKPEAGHWPFPYPPVGDACLVSQTEDTKEPETAPPSSKKLLKSDPPTKEVDWSDFWKSFGSPQTAVTNQDDTKPVDLSGQKDDLWDSWGKAEDNSAVDAAVEDWGTWDSTSKGKVSEESEQNKERNSRNMMSNECNLQEWPATITKKTKKKLKAKTTSKQDFKEEVIISPQRLELLVAEADDWIAHTAVPDTMTIDKESGRNEWPEGTAAEIDSEGRSSCERRQYHLGKKSRWMKCKKCRKELDGIAKTMLP